MNAADLSRLVAESLYLVLWVSAPALAVAMITGLTVAVLSAATQVQEQSLTFVPKVAFVALTLALVGGWMATELIGFTEQLWRSIPGLVG
ncbi:MAG: type III secretion system export apparatus subunit SctS [Myxococcota bacterium]|nr:type III secretion system export apparatus subunit SctS [Myxococcota bacterium]